MLIAASFKVSLPNVNPIVHWRRGGLAYFNDPWGYAGRTAHVWQAQNERPDQEGPGVYAVRKREREKGSLPVRVYSSNVTVEVNREALGSQPPVHMLAQDGGDVSYAPLNEGCVSQHERTEGTVCF